MESCRQLRLLFAASVSEMLGPALNVGDFHSHEREQHLKASSFTVRPIRQIGAIFVGPKTAWIIEGLGHGHQDLARPEAVPDVLSRSENNIVANASIVQYNEITADNVDSFHFHGDLSTYPLTAVLVVPKDEKSGVILRGRYNNDDASSQIVRPVTVIDELPDTILTVQQFVVAAVIIVASATIATAALVILLSVKLRRREIDTMHKIGGSRLRVASTLFAEIFIVVILGAGLAAVLTMITWQFGPAVIEKFVLA